MRQTLLRLPELIRRIEERFPPKGGAPEQPPLPEVELMWQRKRPGRRDWAGYLLALLAGGGCWHGWRSRMGLARLTARRRARVGPLCPLAALSRPAAAAGAAPRSCVASALVPITGRQIVETDRIGYFETARSEQAGRADAASESATTIWRSTTAIIARIQKGENYYDFIVDEQRAAHYRCAGACRPPADAGLSRCLAGDLPGQIAASLILMLGVLLAWWRRLGEEPGGQRYRAHGDGAAVRSALRWG